MQPESIYAVIITLITVLGSAGAWRYYEKRAQDKKEEEDYIKDDCARRIDRLEQLLEKVQEKKMNLERKS